TSVARGLAQTARVITAAAAIMVVVFLSFVLGADVAVKQIGLGLAVAVLIDATLVRMVLVPAVMELLGKAHWWLPAPRLRRPPPPRGPPRGGAGRGRRRGVGAGRGRGRGGARRGGRRGAAAGRKCPAPFRWRRASRRARGAYWRDRRSREGSWRGWAGC